MKSDIPGIDEPIDIVDYDPAWPALFAEERQRLRACLGGRIGRIEHFGSTAVPAMAGKPVVDLLVGVSKLPVPAPWIESLQAMGYENFGEVFIPGRWYLRNRGPPHFNIAVTVEGGEFWRTQLLVRDYLRAHPHEAAAYSEAKRAIYAAGARMFSTYSQAKGPFLAALKERAEKWHASRSVS